jgi:hypothetical protein
VEQIFEAISESHRKNQIQTSGHLFWPVSRKITQLEVGKGLKRWFLGMNLPLLP